MSEGRRRDRSRKICGCLSASMQTRQIITSGLPVNRQVNRINLGRRSVLLLSVKPTNTIFGENQLHRRRINCALPHLVSLEIAHKERVSFLVLSKVTSHSPVVFLQRQFRRNLPAAIAKINVGDKHFATIDRDRGRIILIPEDDRAPSLRCLFESESVRVKDRAK